MEDKPEVLADKHNEVINSIVNVVSAGDQRLKFAFSAYLLAVDDCALDDSYPEFKFLHTPIYTLFIGKIDELMNNLDSMGLDPDILFDILDLSISKDRLSITPDLVLLMKLRFLIDLAVSGIENHKEVLESIKREFRQNILRCYAVDGIPIPKKLTISMDAQDRAYYEKVKLEEYDDPEGDKKFAEKLRTGIAQKVAAEFGDADPKFHQKALELKQQRTTQTLNSIEDDAILQNIEFANLKWDILPDEIAEKFLDIDLIKLITKLG